MNSDFFGSYATLVDEKSALPTIPRTLIFFVSVGKIVVNTDSFPPKMLYKNKKNHCKKVY